MPNGTPVEKDRPSGPDAEHMQYSKTMNAPGQNALREQKRMEQATEAHREARQKWATIVAILKRSKAVEDALVKKKVVTVTN